MGDDRLHEALEALASVEPEARWEAVEARAAEQAPAPLERRVVPRGVPWRLLAGAAVLVAVVAGAVVVPDDGDDEPVQAGPAAVQDPSDDCGWSSPLPFEPTGDGVLAATVGEQVVHVATPRRTDLGDVVGVDGRVVVLDPDEATVQVVADGIGPCSYEVRVDGPDRTANARLAMEVAASFRPGHANVATPCGELGYDGPLGFGSVVPTARAATDPVAITATTAGGRRVVVRIPGAPVIAGGEEVTVNLGTSFVSRGDGGLLLHVPLDRPSGCSMSVEVAGPEDPGDLGLAMSVVQDLTLDSRAAAPAPEAPACAGHLTSSTLPVGFSASLAADGEFYAADDRRVSVGPVGDTVVRDANPGGSGGLEAEVGTVDGEPAALVTPAGGCSQLLMGVGVTTEELEALVSGLYVVDDDRSILLTSPAVWPETAPGRDPAVPPLWRDNPVETAEAFARTVLGWPGAEAYGIEEEGSGEMVMTLVRDDLPAARVDLRLFPAYGGRWWSVVHVDTHGRDPDSAASVSVQGSTASAGASPPPGAEAASVRFDYGGRQVTTAPGEAVDLGFVPDTPGSVLVLFADDATGEIVGAWGTTLPAGDFAAG